MSLIHSLRRLLIVTAPVLVVGAAAAGEPCGACKQSVATVDSGVTAKVPKIVVHMPPPEVVVEGSCGKLLPRRKFHRPCEHESCGQSSAAGALVNTTTTYTAMSFLGAGAFGAGAVNFGFGVPGLMMAGAPAGQSEHAGAFDGLRALQAAELRAAAIVAERARHEAELRATAAAAARLAGAAQANRQDGVAGAAAGDAANTLALLDERIARLEERMKTAEGNISQLRTSLKRHLDEQHGAGKPATTDKSK